MGLSGVLELFRGVHMRLKYCSANRIIDVHVNHSFLIFKVSMP